MNTKPFTIGDAANIIAKVLEEVGFGVKEKPASKQTDEEWIKSLEAEPALAGVDIRREIGKAQFWAKNNRRLATRKFLVNWLNKAERTLTVQMDGQTSQTKVKVDAYAPAPPNWQQAAAKLWPDTDYFQGKQWGEVDVSYRKQIVAKLLSA